MGYMQLDVLHVENLGKEKAVTESDCIAFVQSQGLDKVKIKNLFLNMIKLVY